nr:nicalin [Hymenolepis microstoma]
MGEEFEVPVYFATQTDELELMYEELKKMSTDIDKKNGQSLLDTVFSTGYRAYIDAPVASPMRQVDLVNIEGKFSSGTFDTKKPTIILTAHYDAGGAIPSLAYGANSNAAGVAVLLEVARMLSQLMNSKSPSKYNVMFLLTGGGKVNYLGSKRWLEMMYGDINGIALFDTVEQVINLEGLGANDGDHLFFHVSRLPKEGTFSHRFLTSLGLASKLHPLQHSEPFVEVVHKKINLNQYELAWEHERFALYRLPTATISAWSSPSSYSLRNSVLDGGPLHSSKSQDDPHGFWGPVQPEVVARNAKVITEALARLIFNTSAADPTALESPFIDPSWSTDSSATALMDLLTLQPRSIQLLSAPPSRSSFKTSSNGRSGLISTLEQYMRSFLPDVRLTKHQFAKMPPTTKQDPKSFQQQQEAASAASMPTLSAAGKDPEVVFYSGVAPRKIIVYRLKSSVFDLVVAFFVGSYLYCLHVIFEILIESYILGSSLEEFLSLVDYTMSEIPNHLKGLLRFCLEAGSDPLDGIKPMDPETETVECLEDLIDFTEDINLADIFLKIDGLELLKELLTNPSDEYLSYTGMLLSNVMQNHPQAQSVAIDAGLLDAALDLLPKQKDPGNLGGLLSGISSLIRACNKSIEKFLQLDGLETIFGVLEKIEPEEEYSRFIEKAAFFLYCISQEFSADQRVKLRSSDITRRIADLILKFDVPREFLVRALTFLLVGSISILDDPLADPNPPTPVTLELNKQKALELREWAESEDVQKQLDPDARKSLLNALKKK